MRDAMFAEIADGFGSAASEETTSATAANMESSTMSAKLIRLQSGQSDKQEGSDYKKGDGRAAAENRRPQSRRRKI